jgi:hypothetical protein
MEKSESQEFNQQPQLLEYCKRQIKNSVKQNWNIFSENNIAYITNYDSLG